MKREKKQIMKKFNLWLYLLRFSSFPFSVLCFPDWRNVQIKEISSFFSLEKWRISLPFRLVNMSFYSQDQIKSRM